MVKRFKTQLFKFNTVKLNLSNKMIGPMQL
jgi:hypothetical protein